MYSHLNESYPNYQESVLCITAWLNEKQFMHAQIIVKTNTVVIHYS